MNAWDKPLGHRRDEQPRQQRQHSPGQPVQHPSTRSVVDELDDCRQQLERLKWLNRRVHVLLMTGKSDTAMELLNAVRVMHWTRASEDEKHLGGLDAAYSTYVDDPGRVVIDVDGAPPPATTSSTWARQPRALPLDDNDFPELGHSKPATAQVHAKASKPKPKSKAKAKKKPTSKPKKAKAKKSPQTLVSSAAAHPKIPTSSSLKRPAPHRVSWIAGTR